MNSAVDPRRGAGAVPRTATRRTRATPPMGSGPRSLAAMRCGRSWIRRPWRRGRAGASRMIAVTTTCQHSHRCAKETPPAISTTPRAKAGARRRGRHGRRHQLAEAAERMPPESMRLCPARRLPPLSAGAWRRRPHQESASSASGATTGAIVCNTRLSVSSAFESRRHGRSQTQSPPAPSEKAGLLAVPAPATGLVAAPPFPRLRPSLVVRIDKSAQPPSVLGQQSSFALRQPPVRADSLGDCIDRIVLLVDHSPLHVEP